MSDLFTVTSVDEKEFSKLVKQLSPQQVPIEQSPAWGVFDDAAKDRTFLGSYRYDDGGKLVAVASATLYTQKGRDWVWLKHGPVYASVPNTETVQKMCATISNQFSSVKERQPAFVRLSSPTPVKQLVLPYEHTMYDETVVVDLARPKEAILADMSQSGRRSLRSAQKNAVTVAEVTSDRSAVFESECYPILKETGARDGFGIHPITLYTSMLDSMPDQARLFVAKVDGKTEAWAITTEYYGSSTYYYGGSSAVARKNDAAYLLHWEIMLAMKQRGNTSYDFMGIAGKHFPELANVTQFKLKFSKTVTRVSPTYDLPLKKVPYTLLSTVIKLKRRL